jgi:hypothetical protein
MSVANGSAKLRALTVELPAGLRFVARHHRAVGVSVSGAKIRSLVLTGRHLTIKLARAVPSLTVTIARGGLKETGAIRRAAKAHRLRRLEITAIAQNTRGRRTTIRAPIRRLGL